jgi:hypothetical protein
VNQPAKIGKYQVQGIIGRGGMGVVYKATDPHLDRLVAIKMMTVGFAEDPELLKRFYREAQSTGSLQHPNIVTVYDLGDQDGSPYLVMEYLEGESLESIISSRRQLAAAERVNFVLEACRGLSYAHGRGIVHRDIKPANIMVLKNGGVKLVDFGIAHIASNTLTRTGQIMGSLNYMSPEQIHGRSVDLRTDLFSTGVVLYQLFTNALPFAGDSSASTLLKIINDPPPPLTKFLSAYPKDLETIILRALAKDREDRYQTADEFALDLLQLYEQLKQELVSRYLREAEGFLEKGDLKKSLAQLQQLLRLDQKHTRAISLLREVQQKLERQATGQLVKQLQVKARECYSQGDFDAAVQFLDQAVACDTSNPELRDFLDLARAAKQHAEELRRVLSRAEQAHRCGDLDSAKEAAEQALNLDGNSTQVKAVYRIVHRDWMERSRQRQIDSLVRSAKEEIGRRNLTAALNLLNEAASLGPDAIHVRALLEEVAAGREQERRRKELERVKREIEEALDRDDYQTASAKVEQGLIQYPQDRTLSQLKALADRQRATAERRTFVREQIAAARKLLDADRPTDALAVLRRAIQKVPQEAQLEALLTGVQELVARKEQEQRRKEIEGITREVQDALDREDHESARGKLEAILSRFPGERSLLHLKAVAEKQGLAAEQKNFVRAQIANARQLLDAGQTAKVLALLQTAVQKAPHDPQLETLLSIVQERAAREATEYAIRKIVQQAREALAKNAYKEAIAILEAAQLRSADSREIDELLRLARDQELKQAQQKIVEDATRNARQQIAEYQYDRATQILEATLLQIPDEQLNVILAETRRRGEDFKHDLEALIAKAQQFLQQGEANKAVEFLAAQPEAYSRSPQFTAVLETSRRQQVVESVERQLAQESDLDRRIKILSGAQKNYGGYADWQPKLQAVREKQKRVLSTLQQARNLERKQRYGDALQHWLALRSIHADYPGLATEIARLTRLEEEAHVRAVASAQQKALGEQQQLAVLTPPPVMPTRLDHLSDFDRSARETFHPPISEDTPESELEAGVFDAHVPRARNRKNLIAATATATALVIIVISASIVWFRSTKSSSPKSTTQIPASAGVDAAKSIPPDNPVAPIEAPLSDSPSLAKTSPLSGTERAAKVEKIPPLGTKPEPAFIARNSKPQTPAESLGAAKSPKTAAKENAVPQTQVSAPQGPAIAPALTTNGSTVSSSAQQTQSPTIASARTPEGPAVNTAATAPSPPPTLSRTDQPPLADQNEIRALLGRYAQAFAKKDLKTIKSLWPEIPREKLNVIKESFKLNTEIALANPVFTSTPDGLVIVSCTQNTRAVVDGKSTTSERKMDFYVKKGNAGWFISYIPKND